MDCSTLRLPVFHYLSELLKFMSTELVNMVSLGTLNLKTKINIELNKIKTL